MSSYTVVKSVVCVLPSTGAAFFKVGFAPGVSAENSVLVKDAAASLAATAPGGGPLALINGPASLPVAAVLVHALGHLYGAIGVYDPKLAGYVVAISHTPDHTVGDVIPQTSVS